MRNNTKTRTTPLKAKDYIALSGTPNVTVNLTKLVDDAVEALSGIRYNGYGAGNQNRSRRVISRSFRLVLLAAGYKEELANAIWRDQVLTIDALNITSEE